jgi:hypothetical protein
VTEQQNSNIASPNPKGGGRGGKDRRKVPEGIEDECLKGKKYDGPTTFSISRRTNFTFATMSFEMSS